MRGISLIPTPNQPYQSAPSQRAAGEEWELSSPKKLGPASWAIRAGLAQGFPALGQNVQHPNLVREGIMEKRMESIPSLCPARSVPRGGSG